MSTSVKFYRQGFLKKCNLPKPISDLKKKKKKARKSDRAIEDMDPTITNLQIYPITKTEPSTNSATAWRKWEKLQFI